MSPRSRMSGVQLRAVGIWLSEARVPGEPVWLGRRRPSRDQHGLKAKTRTGQGHVWVNA